MTLSVFNDADELIASYENLDEAIAFAESYVDQEKYTIAQRVEIFCGDAFAAVVRIWWTVTAPAFTKTVQQSPD